MSTFSWMLIAGFVIIVLTGIILTKDDTDKSWFNKSGMNLYTDDKTKLQYLSAGGTLIPRLDENGNHMKEVQK